MDIHKFEVFLDLAKQLAISRTAQGVYSRRKVTSQSEILALEGIGYEAV